MLSLRSSNLQDHGSDAGSAMTDEPQAPPTTVVRKADTEAKRERRGQPTIGLALGAGAARGWSHIGVLRELVDHGI